MYKKSIMFLSAASSVLGEGNHTLGLCSYSATCSVSGVTGVCVSISSGCCSGTQTAGLCPGSSDIKCCTNNPCSTPQGSGVCKQTSACSGTSVSGYCSGPSDVQCCVGSSTSCTTPSGSGVCLSTSQCTGTSISGYCPGSSDVQCCVQNLPKCSTPSGSGTCLSTKDCKGVSYSGYCPGAADIQCCVSSPIGSVFGVDISASVSSDSFSCFKSNGYGTFAVPRGYQSNCVVSSNVCTNLVNANNGGVSFRDVYLFPSPTCSKSASTQMSELVSYINSNCKSSWSGRVWLDIEGSQYWLGSTSSNQNWYKSLVDSCSTYGVNCGIYSGASQWSAIFGSLSFSYGSNLPLWYAHYDNNPSFSDFSAFGGWTKPYAKQYAGDVSLCGNNVDKNYAPTWSG